LRGNRRRRAFRLCHHYGLTGFDVDFQPGDPIGEHSDIDSVSFDQGAVLLFQVGQAVKQVCPVENCSGIERHARLAARTLLQKAVCARLFHGKVPIYALIDLRHFFFFFFRKGYILGKGSYKRVTWVIAPRFRPGWVLRDVS
jgi:hypothetical protein